MTLTHVMQRVMRATRLNTDYFARAITYRLPDESELSIDV